MPYLMWISLLLFCVPAAIYAIGWIDLGQKLGGLAIAPVVAHASRAVALCVLGFAVGYSRLPASLENAAQLVRVSSVTRAAVFVLPIIAGSLIASSALAAALTYSDRDVASLLLAPGASRLTLNLYLASANAPSSTISLLAFAVLGGAALTLILAAAGPALLWRKRA
jgi:ABC-type spermidine/putrescine transport system permease subunit II